MKTFGVGAGTPAEKWQIYIQQLIHLGCLTMSYTDCKTLRITEFGRQVLFGEKKIQLALVTDKMPEPKEHFGKDKPRTGFAEKETRSLENRLRLSAREELEGNDAVLFEALRIYRRNLSDAAGVPPYVIFSDKILLEMVHRHPTCLTELAEIPGIGSVKLSKYGKLFLDVINET